jgi:hypothetical protein
MLVAMPLPAARRERTIRRLLRLPSEPPVLGGHVFEEHEDGLFGIRRLPEDEARAHDAAWHGEGWRGAIANTLAYGHLRLGRRARLALRAPAGAWWAWRARRALSRDRHLVFTSPYIHRRGDMSLEGHFDLGGDLAFPLEVVTPSAMARYIEIERQVGTERVVSSETSLLFTGSDWVVSWSEPLDEEALREALLGWYQDRFRHVRGHWSQVEGRLPELSLDLAWEDVPPEAQDAEQPPSDEAQGGGGPA